MATLINGDGNPAVYAVQDADFYISLLGGQTRILNRGLKFAYHVENINTFLIDDGIILTKEGRRIQLDAYAQDEITIPNGVQGSTQYYIVGYHLYTDASANQKCETFIQQMESSTDTIEEKTFYEGETEVYISLYRITQTELVVSNVSLLLPLDTTYKNDLSIITTDIADLKEMISGKESSTTASKAYEVGDVFQIISGGHTVLVQVTTDIAQGGTIVIYPNTGSNVRIVNVGDIISDVSSFGTRIDNLEASVEILDEKIDVVALLAPALVTASVGYTGDAVSPVFEGFRSDLMTITGNVQTNPGTYTATIGLVDSDNYYWAGHRGENTLTYTWTIALDTSVTWANGTDEQIAGIIKALDNGLVTTSQLNWSVGDERTVHLEAMAASGVGEAHAAQDVTMVIMDTNHFDLVSATSGGKTKSSYVIGLKNSLVETGYMNSSNTNSGSWNGSARRTWCNNTFRAAIPETLRNCFKQFKVITAQTYNGSTNQTSNDYFALFAEKEIFGTKTYSNTTESGRAVQML